MKKWIDKITFPNGKLYVGMDLTGTFRYFGSWPSALVSADFSEDEQRDFTVRREILWQSENASDAEVRQKEIEYICAFRSNDPAIGYNKWPKQKTRSNQEPSN
jgi:hypothetical protein